MKVVIIGASYAGVAAALEVRKRHKDAEIMLLEKQPTLGYIPNGLHLYWDNQIRSLDEAYFITEKQLDAKQIHFQLNTTVQKIHSVLKEVIYVRNEIMEKLNYDKLIIATGSSQLSQKINGSDNEQVVRYKRYDEAEAALATIKASKRVVIIGGGQVGVEAADLLSRQQKQVTLIESMDYVLFKYFDEEMIQPVQKKMKETGIDLKLNETVSAIRAEA